MLKSIVRFSIRHRGIVIALACAWLFYGIYSLRTARYDVFPEFAPPQVSIQTEAPGLSPEQVEQLVTTPIENAAIGVTGVQTVRSGSIQGLSVITVIFQNTGSIYLDRQVVAERLATLTGQLPAGITPVMTPLTSTTSWVMEVGLLSQKLSLMDLTTVAKWVVKRRLLAVPGVANVSVFGAMTRQIQIQYDPEKLIQHNVAVSDVIAAAQHATAIRGAGFVSTANQRIILQTEGQSLTPASIRRTVLVRSRGANLTLGDVADIVDAPAPPVGGASVNGRPALVLVIESQYGANTLEVTRGIDAALSELRPDLTKEGIEINPNVFRPADFILTSLDNVRLSLEIGAVLVIIVLFLFLFNFRTAAISCTAIPLSLLGAVIVMTHTGQSVNTLTLGGLAIAIGEVVDDAVIDVENIYRRLRENRAVPHPRRVWRVVLDASVEVRSAVVYATFAVILVFFPVLTLSGVAGRLFSPLGMAYIWAILISLLVALTVTPALCMALLANRDLPPLEPPVVRILKSGYRRALLGVERWPTGVIAVVALIILAGVLIAPELKTTFLPQLREANLTLHMTMMPGTSIRQSLQEGDRVSRALLKPPYVKLVGQRIGRAELSTDTYGTNAGELPLVINARTGDQYEAAMDDIHETLAKFAGAVFSVNSFLVERINETLSGYSAGVAVNVFGSDLNVLDEKARDVAQALGGIRGVSGVQLVSPPGTPQVVVRLRPQAVERWGLDPVQVLNAVRTAYNGDIVGQIYQGDRVFDVSVILDPSDRRTVAQIDHLPLHGPDGNYIPLGQLADIYENSGRYIIQHEGARRVETVTCNVSGGDMNTFLAAAHRRLSRISFPPGTYVTFAGAAAAQARSHRDLLVHSLLAVLGIVLLLSVVMGHYRNLLLVLLNLPFALVGGVFAAWITHTDLSLGALVGFVTLFGITIRNSIMLISHYEHLVGVESMTWGLDAALRGASERLSPILMTALVTGLGLLPLALGSGDPGREIEGPMAIVILGGLITSTALNLLVLPTLSLRYGRFEPRGPER
ncbi:MAG TPA: efflux RND transporter permease subunit [Terriglobia bacterium]|nr:efflux RND transporter permease subunit [Terriglobia bacterium]